MNLNAYFLTTILNTLNRRCLFLLNCKILVGDNWHLTIIIPSSFVRKLENKLKYGFENIAFMPLSLLNYKILFYLRCNSNFYIKLFRKML